MGSPAGKKRLSKRLAAMLPAHKTYVEPFAGSAAVLFAKEPAPVEVINDADHSKDTAFFLDPPYPGCNIEVGESEFDEERFFKFLMTLKDRFLITFGIREKFPAKLKQSAFWVKRIRTP